VKVARITGQGLTSIAILVVLLWACALVEHLIVKQARTDCRQTVREMHSLQIRNRRQPAATPAHTAAPRPVSG